jgi:hypothetical protein
MSGKYLLQIAAGSMHDLFLNLWKVLIEQNMEIMKIAVSVDSIDVLFITYIMHIVN